MSLLQSGKKKCFLFVMLCYHNLLSRPERNRTVFFCLVLIQKKFKNILSCRLLFLLLCIETNEDY